MLVTQTNGAADASGIDVVNLSSDGRCAVFSSSAQPPAGERVSQIYLRDTAANTTTLVSKGPATRPATTTRTTR